MRNQDRSGAHSNRGGSHDSKSTKTTTQTMASDILFNRHRIRAITTDGSSFEVSTGENEPPDIELSPNWATLELGGGGGENSDGDIKLRDRPDNEGGSKTRIHLSGGRGGNFEGTRVRVDGPSGGAKFGATSVANPDIELKTERGQLRLGGGDGNPEEDHGSVGNVRIDDWEANTRVFVAARGTEPPDSDQNSVYVTGGFEQGQIHLGRVGDAFTETPTSLMAERPQLRLGSAEYPGDIWMYQYGGERTVNVNANQSLVVVGGGDPEAPNADASGTIDLYDDQSQLTASLEAHTERARGGSLTLSTNDETETVTIESNRGPINGGFLRLSNDEGDERVELGSNPPGVNGGEIALWNESDVETVALGSGPASDAGGTLTLRTAGGDRRVSIQGSSDVSNGGAMLLNDASSFPTVFLDGDDGRLRLGGTEEPSQTGAPSRVPGTLTIDDGAGMMVDLNAEDGSVTLAHRDSSKGEVGLELRPEEGVFSVFDGNGDPVFEIDTQAKTIKKAKQYKEGVIGHGP